MIRSNYFDPMFCRVFVVAVHETVNALAEAICIRKTIEILTAW